MVTIRAYRHGDEGDLLRVWREGLPYDPVDPRTFHRKVLLDPNFDPDWLSVAEADQKLVGFCLALIRRTPLEGMEIEQDRGWITAMAVAPSSRNQGIGEALLSRAMTLFQEAGKAQVLISPYTPNYFVPGVDQDRYGVGMAFLAKRGFEVVSRPLSMDANIVALDDSVGRESEAMLSDQGIVVRAMASDEIPLLLCFLKEHMPTDWLRHARDILTDVSKGLACFDQFTLAMKDGDILGYAQFDGEHFGPFGVRPDLQGLGIGTALLARTLLSMREQGLHNAWVLWTSDQTASRVYSRFGFRETRRFAIMRRRLDARGIQQIVTAGMRGMSLGGFRRPIGEGLAPEA